MAARSRSRKPVGALTHARHLHRIKIADDTDSPPRIWRGVPRKSRRPLQMGSPPPRRDCPPLLRRVNLIPRPRACVHLKVVVFGSGSSLAFGFANKIKVWAHRLDSPAASAAPLDRAPSRVPVCAGANDARSRARPPASGSSGGVGVDAEIHEYANSEGIHVERSTGRVHQGRKKGPPWSKGRKSQMTRSPPERGKENRAK